jgi:hypothetical protein
MICSTRLEMGIIYLGNSSPKHQKFSCEISRGYGWLSCRSRSWFLFWIQSTVMGTSWGFFVGCCYIHNQHVYNIYIYLVYICIYTCHMHTLQEFTLKLMGFMLGFQSIEWLDTSLKCVFPGWYRNAGRSGQDPDRSWRDGWSLGLSNYTGWL